MRKLELQITCSCCGNHRKISNEKVSNVVEMIKEGWGSFGTALYCPECTKTWDERNPGRPQPGERNTFMVITGLFLREKNRGGKNDK